MCRPVDLIEVSAWGQPVGAVTLDSSVNYYVFEYDSKWQERGIELAPLNCDNDPKYVAFQMNREGKWGLAPADDITHAFNSAGKSMSQHLMSVNGRFKDISRRDQVRRQALWGARP